MTIFKPANGFENAIEVTPVLRGCAYDPETRSVSRSVEAQFGFAEVQVVSFPDLYAGKLVAALDRQHPTCSTSAICSRARASAEI